MINPQFSSLSHSCPTSFSLSISLSLLHPSLSFSITLLLPPSLSPNYPSPLFSISRLPFLSPSLYLPITLLLPLLSPPITLLSPPPLPLPSPSLFLSLPRVQREQGQVWRDLCCQSHFTHGCSNAGHRQLLYSGWFHPSSQSVPSINVMYVYVIAASVPTS